MLPSEMLKPNPYDRIAKFYDPMFDAFVKQDPMLNHDIPLYLSLAENSLTLDRGKSRFLEVGCGTGRILLPFLKAGYNMIGIDTSNEMLDQCRMKQKIPEHITEGRLRLLQHDFSQGTINDHFSGAFVSGFTMNYVPEENQQVFLDNVGKTLLAGSPIAVDLFYPQALADPTIRGWEIKAASFKVDGRNINLYTTRSMEKSKPNVERRTRKFKFADGEEIEDVTYRTYIKPMDAKAMLEKAGFRDISLMRDYNWSSRSQDFTDHLKEDYNYVLVGYKI